MQFPGIPAPGNHGGSQQNYFWPATVPVGDFLPALPATPAVLPCRFAVGRAAAWEPFRLLVFAPAFRVPELSLAPLISDTFLLMVRRIPLFMLSSIISTFL